MNDSENLGKLQPKADIGIFIGYAPTKKAFRIYNQHTRRIIKTIHVDFDELNAMASEHSCSGPALHEMTPATIIALVLAALISSPSSTTVDQDAPSPSNSQTTPKTQSHGIPNDVEEDGHHLDVAHMNNDLFFGIPIPKNDSKASLSLDVIPTVVHTAAPNSEHITKWTKDHPLDNIIDELEIPVSIRLQTSEKPYFVNAFLLRGILKQARLVARGYVKIEGIAFEESFALERIEFLINKLGMQSFTPETLKQLADEAEE
ncbi:retrovirus-related pol polyprotein from transposon TNT 1-94 [Tanacetum coccineum]